SLLYEQSEVPVQGRNAGGVRGIQLNDGDSVIFAGQIGEDGEVLVVSDRTFAKRVFAFSLDVSKRYRKGVKIVDMPENHHLALVDYVKTPYDIAVINDAGELQGFNTEDVKLDSRTAKGKQLVKNDKKQIIKRHAVDYFKPLNA
ncbi:MAG: DNA gyrase C-terminal beta-propeller domain-containing protein, partial [Clostridia bacterium]